MPGSAGTDPLTGCPNRLRETHRDYCDAEALTRLQRQVDEDQHTKSDITVRQAVERWLDDAHGASRVPPGLAWLHPRH